MSNELIRVRVLHGFVLGPGEVTAPGDVIELDRSFAMQVLVSNKAERVPDVATVAAAEPAADPPAQPEPEPDADGSETEPSAKRRRA